MSSARRLLEMLGRLVLDQPYEPVAEAPGATPVAAAADELPRLAADASMDDRYARLTRLHRDLAGEWFEAELAGGRGTRIVFVLDEQRAHAPGLRALVRANLARLWRQPVDGLPRFQFLMESGDSLVAEWDGGGGGDFASWLKLRRKPALREVIAFLAGVARVADATVDRGVPGVGLMAFQVRLEADSSSEGSGLGGAAPRLFPLLLDAGDLPPGLGEAADASGSTLVLVGPELACDRIQMLARLIYRAVARHEVADAVALVPEAYVPVSGLSEAGNQLLCQALCRRRQWDCCLSLLRALAAQESLALTGSGSGKGSTWASSSGAATAQHVRPATAARPAQVSPAAPGGPSPPPWPARRAAARRLALLCQRVPRGAWLGLGIVLLVAVAGAFMVRSLAARRADPSRRSSVLSVPAMPAAAGPAAALARGEPYVNLLGMRFVEAGSKRVMFGVWETRVGDFRAFVAATGHDAVSNTACGMPAYTMERGTEDAPIYQQAGGSWMDPHFGSHPQNDQHPVVCVSYHDAEAFCQWLTRSDPNLSGGWRYRLPRDQEWSAACSEKFLAGDGRPPRDSGNYCGSEAMVEVLQGYRNELAQSRWGDAWPRTAPVGRFKPNRFGLYDLGGNVAEWCATFYQSSLNSRDVLAAIPVLASDEGGAKLRVLRGAAWSDWQRVRLAADFRDGEEPLVRNDAIGFRVVLTEDPAAAD